MDAGDLLLWSFYAPLVSVPVCIALFVAGYIRNNRGGLAFQFGRFVIAMLVGVAISMAPVAAWVLFETARANSGNGPLLFVFVAPGAASVGAVAAAGVWCLRAFRAPATSRQSL